MAPSHSCVVGVDLVGAVANVWRVGFHPDEDSGDRQSMYVLYSQNQLPSLPSVNPCTESAIT